MVKRIGQDMRSLQRTYFREWRAYRELSQEALAERLGTTKSAVSKMENGKALYNQSSLEAWAFALNCRPADLISRDPHDRPDIPIFDLPEGDQRRVFEFIRALQVTRETDAGEPLEALPSEQISVRQSKLRKTG